MKEDFYISLITKSLSNETSEIEESDLRQWIASSLENEKTFIEYKKIWDAAELENDFEPDVTSAFEKFENNIDSYDSPKVIKLAPQIKRKPWKLIAGIAASLIVVFGGIAYYLNISSATNDTFVVFESKSVQKTLPDGSSFWMNKGSKIAYNSSFKKREIELEGEAFFEIQKDPSRPFEIHCDVSVIKVLGTSFNVKEYLKDKKVIVTVVTGKVELSTSAKDIKVILVKNDKGIINLETGDIEIQADKELNALSWKEDKLIFDNETMENISESISNHFQIKVEVSEQIKNCRFTAEFNHPKIEEIIELFENYFAIRLFDGGKHIQITGTSCD